MFFDQAISVFACYSEALPNATRWPYAPASMLAQNVHINESVGLGYFRGLQEQQLLHLAKSRTTAQARVVAKSKLSHVFF
jgi:hypothetical protein